MADSFDLSDTRRNSWTVRQRGWAHCTGVPTPAGGRAWVSSLNANFRHVEVSQLEGRLKNTVLKEDEYADLNLKLLSFADSEILDSVRGYLLSDRIICVSRCRWLDAVFRRRCVCRSPGVCMVMRSSCRCVV